MNAYTPPRDFPEQPHRAHDVIRAIGRAHLSIGSALVPNTRRPSRKIRDRMMDVLKAIQFLPMYLDGLATMDVEGALSDASNAIDALDAAIDHDRGTIAGRFAEWRHFRRHPEEYHVVRVRSTPSGKGVGMVIPQLLKSDAVFQIYDRKADPDTRH